MPGDCVLGIDCDKNASASLQGDIISCIKKKTQPTNDTDCTFLRHKKINSFYLLYVICRMQKCGLNTYMYAPKDDYKHRAYWRELYSVEEAGK